MTVGRGSGWFGLSWLSRVYGRAAASRRAAFDDHPERVRWLSQPVISVGNLVVGGSGKTPVVRHLATLLRDAGERPAILSRGYGRTDRRDAVVMVSDGTHILADVARAGDEPLMLARSLAGVGVFVAAERIRAGEVAEQTFGATVHILDDGFQHFGLGRDVELVLVSPSDLGAEQVLPAGRLREPPDTVRRADALLVNGASLTGARALAVQWGVDKGFVVTRTPAVPRTIEPFGAPPRVPRDAPVLVVAGVARPERFLQQIDADGWRTAGTLLFGDHHRFTRADLAEIARRAKTLGASLVLTTEKDMMRLLPLRPLPVPVAWVPLTVAIDPAEDFELWLRWRLIQARDTATRGADASRDTGTPGMGR